MNYDALINTGFWFVTTEQTPNPPPILTHASGNAPPPIPPRKDLKCNTVPDEDSPEYLAMEGTDGE